jgi:hypothetical protein
MKVLKQAKFPKHVTLRLLQMPFDGKLRFEMEQTCFGADDKQVISNEVMVIEDTYQAACAVFASQSKYLETTPDMGDEY